MLSTKSKLKDTFVLFFFNILLTSGDIFSDLWLTVKILRMEKDNARIWGYFLIIPFLTNYILTYLAWCRVDQDKTLWSVVASTLDWYPQSLACEVILLLWTDEAKALKKKKIMEREVLEFEAFTESLPTMLILVCMWTQWKRTLNDEVSALTIGHSRNLDPYFVFTFGTSSLAVFAGFFKSLVLGPCRAHTNNFFHLVLLCLSVFCSFVVKVAITWIVLFSFHSDYSRHKLTSWIIFRDTVWPLLPQILIAFLALPSPMTITHPSLVLVPLFTWYTFSGSNSCYSKIVNCIKKIKCNSLRKKPPRKLQPAITDASEKKQNNLGEVYQESFIRFSPGWTLLNIGFTIAGAITHTLIY